jgi:hypothetical protein
LKKRDHAIGCRGLKTVGLKIDAELPDSRTKELIYYEKGYLSPDGRKRNRGRKNPEYCTLCVLDKKGNFSITFNVRTNTPSFYIEHVRNYLTETFDAQKMFKLLAVLKIWNMTKMQNIPYLDILDRESIAKMLNVSPEHLNKAIDFYVAEFEAKIARQRKIWKAWLHYHSRHRLRKR